MTKKSTKYASLLCVITIVAIVFGCLTIMLADKSTDDIVIYHTNDMHGNVGSVWEDENLKKIGLDMIKSMKDNTPNSLLVDCGDAIWGTQFAKANRGLDIIDMMNAAGYDCMSLGNHEFDYGQDALLDCVRRAKFPVLSANTYKNGKVLLDGINGNNGQTYILEIAGKRIGFFGLTTEETSRITTPENLDGIEFRDEIEIAKLQVQKLKSEKVDIIIAVAHVGIDSSSKTTSKDIARKVSGIDAIIDGHSHTEYIGKENDTVITQTGANLSCLGKITIKFGSNKPEILASLIPAKEVGMLTVADNNITKMYNDLYSKISPSLERIIGKIQNTLYGGTYEGVNISRFAETNMGDFICDAMLDAGKEILKGSEFEDIPVVAFENGGAVRSKIDNGYIKMDQVYSLFPLDNRLSIQIITPKILYQLLERGVGKLTFTANKELLFSGAFGGFPQVCGMKFEINPSLEAYNYNKNTGGKRVQNLKILDSNNRTEQLLLREDNQTKIAFIFNNYALYEFPQIKDIEPAFIGDYLYNVVSGYIAKLTYESGGEFFYPGFQGRISITLDSFESPAYDSEITLKDETGKLSLVSVNVSIDGGEERAFKADENAKITLKNLPSSKHIIRVRYGDKIQEIYINNEIGIKNNTVEFKDKFWSDISSVSNLIGQIPYDITKNEENLIKFARSSYDNLNEKQKDKILNYKKLQEAEENLRLMGGETVENNILCKITAHKIFLTILSVSVFVTGIMIIYIYCKKQKSHS